MKINLPVFRDEDAKDAVTCARAKSWLVHLASM